MAVQIIDTDIQISRREGDVLELNLGVDTAFTGNDLTEAQTGAARFDMVCTILDDDTFRNDTITTDIQRMEPQSIGPITGVNMPFVLSLAELDQREPAGEGTIELFGEFQLRRNGRRRGGVVQTRNVDVALPD